MAKIESKIGKLDYKDEIIYRFLSDFNNFEDIVPKDKVSDWQSDTDSCSFKVEGIGSAGMRISEKEPFKLIKISSQADSPVSFTMWIQLKMKTESDTRVKITVEPKVNAFMMPMVKSPLKKFADILIERLEEMDFPD